MWTYIAVLRIDNLMTSELLLSAATSQTTLNRLLKGRMSKHQLCKESASLWSQEDDAEVHSKVNIISIYHIFKISHLR